MTQQYRPAWVEVDLGAIRANVAALAEAARPARLMAVVKAGAYGHGAVPVARAALDASATWLGVALVEEGIELRDAGIRAPILVLSEPPIAAAAAVVAHDLTPFVYTASGIEALAKAVVAGERGRPRSVHLKVDTGMHRVGCTPADAVALATSVGEHDELVLGGVATHLAVADQRDNPETGAQLDRFDGVIADLDAAGLRPPLAHAANSAGMLGHPRAHYDLVRPGIAIYGTAPVGWLADRVSLRPALSLRARVTFVKELPAGSGVSYGLTYSLSKAGRIATVPLGYADGVPRALGSSGGEVLINGTRLPIAGRVTMDQFMVDAGDASVEPGDEVVLVGRQGEDEIPATEVAGRVGTIAYEIIAGLGSRVPRTYRQ
ncbi:MAG: alanine racemase [Acidimicrobiia bacterium]